jgi:hypothetical protein
MAGKHTVKNLGEGDFEYRGIPFYRNDSTPTGYWGGAIGLLLMLVLLAYTLALEKSLYRL